jgi:hypothetical protein
VPILNSNDPFVVLDMGVPTTVLNAATSAGTGQPFTVQPRTDGAARTVSFQAVISGSPTTVTVNLEASNDGGTTWTTYQAALAFLTASWQTVLNLVAGPVYRLNLTTLSGGTSPSVTVNASAS